MCPHCHTRTERSDLSQGPHCESAGQEGPSPWKWRDWIWHLPAAVWLCADRWRALPTALKTQCTSAAQHLNKSGHLFWCLNQCRFLRSQNSMHFNKEDLFPLKVIWLWTSDFIQRLEIQGMGPVSLLTDVWPFLIPLPIPCTEEVPQWECGMRGTGPGSAEVSPFHGTSWCCSAESSGGGLTSKEPWRAYFLSNSCYWETWEFK